ncbi:zinc-binding dehydrogenase [Pseudomonas saxonica]|uniref:Zinc-binding dehydrogenase n=1 Tax=Pseudomonas saxonica TaxID=2600598 RepID=A0ABY3GHF2_9PSED|nr:zinc-binding dehydrogenase [Pseudomonas saxonica]
MMLGASRRFTSRRESCDLDRRTFPFERLAPNLRFEIPEVSEQYGALETTDLSVPVMELLGKDLTIRGYQLFEITQDPERLNRAKDFITKGLEGGALQPIISKTFPLSEMVEAHQYMESNAQIGKIVIEL